MPSVLPPPRTDRDAQDDGGSLLNQEPPSRVFDAVLQAFRLLTTGPQSLALDGHLVDGLPDRLVDLAELARLLPAMPQATQDAVWAELVARARSGAQEWVVGAVGVALPSLVKIACELSVGYAEDVEDVHAEVLAGFCRKLRTLDPDAGRLFARLYWAARRDGAKWRNRESDYIACTQPTEPEPIEPPPPAGHPDLVLAQAVRDGVLSEWEATVIGLTRLEATETAQTLTSLAPRYGLTRRQLRYARDRAEKRLADYLADKNG